MLDPKIRLQAIATALFEHRVTSSLVDVERALAKWRDGSHGVLDVHGVVLRHAARCERTVECITAAIGNRPDGILRDAVDAGLMGADEFRELVGKAPADVASIGALEDDTDPPNKRWIIEQLLARGPVLVYVDARRAEVTVPAQFRVDPRLALRFGLNLSPAIGDFTIDDHAIAGTLMFAGQPFHCVLPWALIYAAKVDGEPHGTLWPQDIPGDAPIGGGIVQVAEPPQTARRLKIVE